MLDEPTAVLVAEMARLQARTVGDTEDYVVTREFKALTTPEQRKAMLKACFAIGAENGIITAEEASVINEIARELDLDQDTVNEVRAEYHELLSSVQAVRRDRPGPDRDVGGPPTTARQASWRSTTPSPSRRRTSASRSES